jgi:membrane protein YqaA with SNARE-associated domain
MLRALYAYVIRLAAGPWAAPALAAVALVEATFPFPPPEVMLGPMVLARRDRAWLYAAICTCGSVGGGMIGYSLGYFLAPLGLAWLTMIGHPDALASFQRLFGQYGLWVILVKGLTPVPYLLVTIASGIARFSFLAFVLASIATRGGRFFLGAALLQHPQAKAVIERRLNLLAVIGVLLIVAALFAVRWLEHHSGG